MTRETEARYQAIAGDLEMVLGIMNPQQGGGIDPMVGLLTSIDDDLPSSGVNPLGTAGGYSSGTYTEIKEIEENLGTYMIEGVMNADHGQINDDA